LLAELRRIGVEGRQKIITDWSPSLPSNVDTTLSLLSEPVSAPAAGGTSSAGIQEIDDDDDDENLLSGGSVCFLHFSIYSHF